MTTKHHHHHHHHHHNTNIVFEDGQNSIGKRFLSNSSDFSTIDLYRNLKDFVLVYLTDIGLSIAEESNLIKIRKSFIDVLVEDHKIQCKEVQYMIYNRISYLNLS